MEPAGRLTPFAALYWLLDVNPNTALRAAAARWTKPFVIYGDGGTLSLGKSLCGPIRVLPIAPVNTSLLYALLFNAGMSAIAWFMSRKKWLLKVLKIKYLGNGFAA